MKYDSDNSTDMNATDIENYLNVNGTDISSSIVIPHTMLDAACYSGSAGSLASEEEN